MEDLSKCSYATLLANAPPKTTSTFETGIATCFVSHAWKYPFKVLIESMKLDASRNPGVLYWLDIVAINQHKAGELPDLFWQTAFKHSVKSIGRTLLILYPWTNPIPLTRSWCLWEIFATVSTNSLLSFVIPPSEREGFEFSLSSRFEDLMNLVGAVDVRKSTAYLEKDRKRIFQSIENSQIKLDDLNMIVMNELRRWLIAEGLSILTKHWPTTLPSSIFKELKNNRGEFSHTKHHHVEELLSNTNLLRLANQVSRLLLEFTKYDVALDLLRCAVKFGEEAKDVDEYDEEMQNASNFLCWLLIDRSRYDEAMSLLQKVYQRNKIKLGWESNITLQCAAHLLRCYHETGKLKLALAIGEEALSACKSNDSVRVLELKFCVGKLLIDMNCMSRAKTLLEDTIVGCEKNCVKRHWIKMSSEAFLGRALMAEGDFDRAQDSLRNALRDARIARGEDHKITLYAKSFLSRLLVSSSSSSSSKNLNEINSILPRCLADCSRLLGRRHWLTLYCQETQAMVSSKFKL